MKMGSKMQIPGMKEQRHWSASSRQKVHKEEAGGRGSAVCLFWSLGGRCKGCIDQRLLQECWPFLVKFLALMCFQLWLVVNPVLTGPLWAIQQGWNKAPYCCAWKISWLKGTMPRLRELKLDLPVLSGSCVHRLPPSRLWALWEHR